MSEHTGRYEGGRRYQDYRQDAYYLPNDDEELKRLDVQHACFRLLIGDVLHLSPLPQAVPMGVLDLGTGTGIWAEEFVREFPQATVTGIDISPVIPASSPSSCIFKVGDFEADWSTFTSDRYDYIHARMLLGGMHNPERFVSQAYTYLKPGGWFEWQELCFDFQCACPGVTNIDVCKYRAAKRWGDLMQQSALKLGKNMQGTSAFGRLFDISGLSFSTEVVKMLPVGIWMKHPTEQRLGRLAQQVIAMGVEGISTGFMTKGLGMDKSAIDVVVLETLQEVCTSEACHYMRFHTYYGQKPRN